MFQRHSDFDNGIQVDANVDGIEWYAVRTKPVQNVGREQITIGGECEEYRARGGGVRQRRVKGSGERVFAIEHLLRRAGFSAFYPKTYRDAAPLRFNDPKNNILNSGDRRRIASPLMQGWIFVGWREGAGRWHDLERTGLVTPVTDGLAMPRRLSGRVMFHLMDQYGDIKEMPKELKDFIYARRRLELGTSVTVDCGIWHGLSATVSRDDGGELVTLISEMLGRSIKVDVPAASVVPVKNRLTNENSAC